MDIAILFEWFAQESASAAEMVHEQPEREIWFRLALMWALAALRSRHEEAGAIGEDAAAAVYLGGDAPRAAQGRAYVSSRSFAHVSHCRQAVSNCALPPSSCRVAVRAHVSWLVEDAVQRPEKAHALMPAALLVDAAHRALAAVDSEVLPVLIDGRRQPGWAHGERHQRRPRSSL